MRVIRMLGLALVAMLVFAIAASSTAMAAEKAPSEKEIAEFEAFRFCPFGEEEVEICLWSQSTYKEKFPKEPSKAEWEAERERPAPELPSEFTAGNITVLLKNAITLQGGGTAEKFLDAVGGPTIEPVRQAGPALAKTVDKELLSPSELQRYNFFTKITKQTKTTLTIEKAEGTSVVFNLLALLEESGTAFGFPVKVHLESPFVGEDCYVGSDSEPIFVEFTTGESGSLRGKNGSIITTTNNGTIITVLTSTLVSQSFAEPGVQGCGVEGGADAAINAALGLPARAGVNKSVINGTLRAAGAPEAKEGLEKYQADLLRKSS